MPSQSLPGQVSRAAWHHHDRYGGEVRGALEVGKSSVDGRAFLTLPGLLQQFWVSFLVQLEIFTNFLFHSYTKNAISVRTGGVLLIEDCKSTRSLKNDPNHWQTLCIEEPFDLTNTARSTYDGEVFRKIKDVFFSSFYRLKETRNLESVFTDPLFTQQQQQQYMMGQMKYIVTHSMNVPMSMAVASDVKSWGRIEMLYVVRRRYLL